MRKFVIVTSAVVGLAAMAGCQFSVQAGGQPAAAPVQTPATQAAIPAPKATIKFGKRPGGGFIRLPSAGASSGAAASSGATASGGTVPAVDAGASSSGGSSGTVPSAPPVVSGATLFGSNVADAESFMGNIYFLPTDTQKLPDFSKLSISGSLFAKTFAVADGDFTTGFPGVDARSEFFGIVYDGPLTVTKDAVYEMRLVSDDGARMLIDDTLIIDNDGVHAMKEAKGPVRLDPGVHALRIEYFQGAKPRVALQAYVGSAQLKMAERTITTQL
jgi:hypothetical protein